MNPFNVKDNTTIDTGKLEKIFLEEGICKKLKKNDYLIRQNEKNSQIGFVSSGIFRLSHIDGNANEWIVGYSFKDDFVCDYPSLMSKTNSTVNIQASTACEVYLLTSVLGNRHGYSTSGKTNSRKYVCRNIPAFIRFLLRYSRTALSDSDEAMS